MMAMAMVAVVAEGKFGFFRTINYNLKKLRSIWFFLRYELLY